MRKTLLFAVLLLLAMALPTVCMAPGWEPKYANRPVTFTGDIGGNADLEVYEHKNKVVIEWESINLNVPISGGLGKLHVRIHKKNGRVMIRYRFGEITEGPAHYQGRFKFQLEGSRKWSEGKWSEGPPHTCTVDVDGAFTIYELHWRDKEEGWPYQATFEEVWSGSLSFTIKIEPPIEPPI